MWEVCGMRRRHSTLSGDTHRNCGKRGEPGELPPLLPHMAETQKSYEYQKVLCSSRGVVHSPTVSTTTTNFIILYKV